MISRMPGVSHGAVSAVTLLALAAVMCSGPESVQAAPIKDTFKSDDMDGGTFLTGRYSEGFAGNPGGVGNGAHAGSWDGTTLYSHWELSGPVIDTVTELADHRVSGDGTVVVQRSFDVSGAALTLKDGGPWDGGDGTADYTVNLDFYEQTVTMLYVGGTMVFSSSVESLTGDFAGFADYRLVGQACGAYVGQGPSLPDEDDWPSWIPTSATSGSWGEVGLIQFRITPEPASLALIGAGLGGLGLTRRRR